MFCTGVPHAEGRGGGVCASQGKHPAPPWLFPGMRPQLEPDPKSRKTPQDTPGFSCSCNSGESFSRASLCQLLLHCVKASAWISQGRASAGSRIHPPAPGAAGNTNPARPPPQQFGQRGRSGAQPGRCCRVSPAAAPPGLAQSPAELHRDGNNRGSRDQPGNGGRREGRAGAALGVLLWLHRELRFPEQGWMQKAEGKEELVSKKKSWKRK